MTQGIVLPNLLPMVEKQDNDGMPIRYPGFAERLQKAMTDGNLSVTDIKTRLKVSYEMARRYSLGQAMPRQEKLAALAAVVGKTPSYLAFGTDSLTGSKEEGPMVGVGRPVVAVDDNVGHPGAIRIRKVKLRLSAGIIGFAVEPIEGDGAPIYLPEEWLQKRGYRRDDLIAIEVKGQSMEPSLFDGDTVVINTADTKPVDGEVYAVNYEGEAVVKRMVKELGSWWLISDNTDQRRYPKKQCASDMCIIVGKVVRKESDRI